MSKIRTLDEHIQATKASKAMGEFPPIADHIPNGATRTGVRAIQAKANTRTSALKATLRYGEMVTPVQITKVSKRKDGKTIIRVKASGPFAAQIVQMMKLYEQGKPLRDEAARLEQRFTTIRATLGYHLSKTTQPNAYEAYEYARRATEEASWITRGSGGDMNNQITSLTDLNGEAINEGEELTGRILARYQEGANRYLTQAKQVIEYCTQKLADARKWAAQAEGKMRLAEQNGEI